MNKSLVTVDELPRDIIDAPIPGAEAMGRDDMMIPRLVLTQAQSADLPDNDKHLGEWYNTLTGVYAREVCGVMLGMSKGRIMFPEKFSRDSVALCASDDALHPRDEYLGANVNGIDIPAICADCPFSKFGDDGTPPACAKGYQFAFIDSDSVPYVVRLQRTGTAAAKQLVMIGKTIKRRRVIRLSSKQIKSDNGAYYEPVIGIAGETSQDMLLSAAYMSEIGNLAARQLASADEVHADRVIDQMPDWPEDDTKQDEEIPW